MPTPDQNRRTAVAFHGLMFNECRPREATEAHAGETCIQHNCHVGDGKEAFIAYFERMATACPRKRIEVKWTVAENDLVENRDVLQTLPETSANDNGMF